MNITCFYSQSDLNDSHLRRARRFTSSNNRAFVQLHGETAHKVSRTIKFNRTTTYFLIAALLQDARPTSKGVAPRRFLPLHRCRPRGLGRREHGLCIRHHALGRGATQRYAPDGDQQLALPGLIPPPRDQPPIWYATTNQPLKNFETIPAPLTQRKPQKMPAGE